MPTKHYVFTEKELVILREACLEYSFMLKAQASKGRAENHAIAHQLFKQFKSDFGSI